MTTHVQSQQLQPLSIALSLPLFLKRALLEAGYKTVGDLEGIHASELATELRVGVAQAEDITRQLEYYKAGPSSQVPRSATQAALKPNTQANTVSELLSSSGEAPIFTTGCTSLDRLVSSFADGDPKGKRKAGLSPGMVLEISGPPGGGKTCACIALALSARCQVKDTGELDDSVEVLIVDTEGGMSATRILHGAEAALRSTSASPSAALRGIHFIRVATQTEMIAFWHTLDEWLSKHPKVKLVVVDTLTFHFRQPTLDLSIRRRLMELVRSKVGQASTVHGCAVVIANQLATKMLTAGNKPANLDDVEARAMLMPQLGELWTSAKTVRVVLFRGSAGDPVRYGHASMSAASSKEPPWASFTVDADGQLQDADYAD